MALARLKVADHERRLPNATNARSVQAAFTLYLRSIESGVIELAPRTLVTTRSATRTMAEVVLPDGRRLGDIRLSRLSWQDIEQCYAALRASGRGTEWTRRCATVLNRSLELARKRGLIESNPCKDAARPRTVRSKPFSPSATEVRAVLNSAARHDAELGDIALVLASTGMRKGEVLGLRWRDVDLVGGEVHVAASISDGGPGVGLVRKPTKRSDWRDVPLTNAATAALARQFERRRDLVRSDPDPSDYVFAGSVDGRIPTRPESLSNRWMSTRGTSSITLLHLRHFAATAMLDAGESYRTVADILGNSESTLRLHYDGRTNVGKRSAVAALEIEE